MKRKHLINAIAIILTTGGLVACGGGSSDGTIDSTTADKTVFGTIEGFGSVIVNGVEFETDTNTGYDVDDDSTAEQSDLAIGMKVKIEGTVNADGVTGTAASIYYDDDIEGPVEGLSIDGTIATFNIFGMQVQAEDGVTQFDDEDGSNSLSFGTLKDGDNVEVSGYVNGDHIVATRIEQQDEHDDEFEVKGTVDSYDGSQLNLTLQNGASASFSVSTTTTVESEISPGTTNVFVEAKLNSNQEVIEIELEDEEDLMDDVEGEVSLEGILSGDYTDGFMVNDVEIKLDAGTEYEPASLEGTLVAGMEVEVEGSMVDGVLFVVEIESEEDFDDDSDGETEDESETEDEPETEDETVS